MSLALTGPFETARLPVIAADPVTVTVARKVASGREAEFLAWADDLVAAVRSAPGCLGAAVFHPGEAGGEYQIVVRFSNGMLLRDWERSEVRNELMERADRFVTGARLQRTVGVDEWFEAASHAQPKRPWWKRLLIDVALVYPVSMLMSVAIAPYLGPLPLPARVLVGALVITIALQAVVFPIRRRIRARRRL
jgi:uncharacterized protein